MSHGHVGQNEKYFAQFRRASLHQEEGETMSMAKRPALQTLWINWQGGLTAKEQDGNSMPLYSASDVDRAITEALGERPDLTKDELWQVIIEKTAALQGHDDTIIALRDSLIRTLTERDALRDQVAESKEALRQLYDHQNGCPLPKYEAGWNAAMNLARKALREYP